MFNESYYSLIEYYSGVAKLDAEVPSNFRALNIKKCPVVRDVGDEKIEIKDDYGNSIVITKDQAQLIPQALKQL